MPVAGWMLVIAWILWGVICYALGVAAGAEGRGKNLQHWWYAFDKRTSSEILIGIVATLFMQGLLTYILITSGGQATKP